MAIGRISGPLLKANLVRDGVDLAFETDLLYLDVNHSRVGVRTASPQYDLDVNGTTRTTNLIVDTQAKLGNIGLSGNTITSTSPTINFIPSGGEAVVYHSRILLDDIELQGNTISTYVSNANLELRPNGSGILEVFSNTTIRGNLNVTGNINATGDVTIGGNIVIGDQISDTITINAAIKSDLIPESDNTYSLGSQIYQWKNVYVQNLVTDNLSVSTLDLGNLIFQNNEITTTPNTDLVLYGNGTGGVKLGNFKFRDNTITNVANNAISQLISTGDGYFKIAGTNGVVLPRGNNAQRPTSYAVVGMTRYNTENRALEIWDGFAWSSPTGTTGAISQTQANDIGVVFAIMLG